MRILRVGKVTDEDKIRAICMWCDTQIEFIPAEAQRINDQRDGDYWEIECPTCGRPIRKAVIGKHYC